MQSAWQEAARTKNDYNDENEPELTMLLLRNAGIVPDGSCSRRFCSNPFTIDEHG
jgi:hypothetical protein